MHQLTVYHELPVDSLYSKETLEITRNVPHPWNPKPGDLAKLSAYLVIASGGNNYIFESSSLTLTE
ncbi:hypothetical protein D3C78_1952390 [compost metagenome]